MAAEFSPALTTILESITDSVVSVDGAWRYVYVNPAAARLLQKTRDEMLGRRLWEVFPDLGGTRFESELLRAMKDRVRVEIEELYDGVGRWIHMTAYPMGEGLTLLGQDVTERRTKTAERESALEREKAVRAEVERSEQLYRTLANTMPQMVWGTDALGHTHYLNDRWYEYTGLPPGNPADAGSAIHPDDREEIRGRWIRAVANGTPLEMSLRIRSASGSYRWFITRAVPSRAADGTIVGWIGTSTDIEEEKQHAEHSHESWKLLQKIIDHVPIGIWITDATGHIRQSNAAGRRIWEGERYIGPSEFEQYKGWRLDGSRIRGDEWAAARALATREPYAEEEIEIETFDGKRKRILNSAIPLIDEDELLGVLIVNQDVTERRRMEEEQQSLMRRLEQTQRIESLGRVAATIAHEINNILMAIQPMADLVERRTGDPILLGAAAQIARALQRGKRVTETILRYTRPAEPALDAVELGSVVARIAEEASVLVPHTIDVSCRVPAEPIASRGDAAQLEQVLMNLILNARDAMPNGGRLALELAPATQSPIPIEPSRPWAEIRVSDTGHGMTPDVLGRIFEPFFTTREQGGTGLGLPVAYQIVKAHGGILDIGSAPGEGTVVRLLLPMAPSAEIAARERRRDDAAVPEPLDILLVEDEPDVADGVKMLLELDGFTVRVASSAAEAQAKIEEEPPDVVVLDVGLPDMEGTRLFEIVRTAYPSLPVIFSTGHHDAGRLERYLTQPRVACLLKPYATDELVGKIGEVAGGGG